jgi:hypothetical protein
MLAPFSFIKGVTVNGLLLDLYPNASAAYSLRKLRTAYTGNALRIRRSSDNTESDIGFLSNGNFNSAAAVAFCGAGDGFVTIWYDQSGNANNAAQTILANQQNKIVDNGVIVTNLNKPALYNVSSNANLLMTNRTNNLSVFLVRNINSLGGGDSNFILGDTENFDYHVGYPNYLSSVFSSSNVRNGSNYSNGVLKDFTTSSYPISSTDLISMIHADTARSNSLFIDRLNEGRTNLGYIQEVVLYPSNKSSVRVGIQNNINSYYGIY